MEKQFDVYSEISLGEELSNDELCAVFKCGP